MTTAPAASPTPAPAAKRPSVISPVLLAGSAIMLVGFGIRAGFGVFQIPIQDAYGWARSDFSLAIAIQNLAWGFGQPVFGAAAERFGDRKAIVAGAVMYALGLGLTATATTPFAVQSLEVLVGFGIAGTGFGVILAAVGRSTADEHRSLALGLATAAGSAGQVVGPPLTRILLSTTSLSTTFLILAGLILATVLLVPFMGSSELADADTIEPGLRSALTVAAKDPSYSMIFVGFFSCGFQLAFVTAHFPAFVTEASAGISPDGILAGLGITSTADLGAASLAVIGVFNIIGTISAGWLGSRRSRKWLLSGVYLGRVVAATWFILTPMTPTTVIIFAAIIGSLWLATVPLTSGLVAHIYGLRYMGTLYGLVFLSHQLGGFLGVWLGGRFYDAYGNYTAVWWIGIGVGVVSAIVHLPVIETPIVERAAADRTNPSPLDNPRSS